MRVPAIVVSSLFLGLTGCIAVWGSSYHIESESPSRVTIRYDAAATDSWRIQQHADESCAKYQKTAVPLSQRTGVVLPGGSIAEIVFACDTPAEAARATPAPLSDASIVFTPPAVPPPAPVYIPPRVSTLPAPPSPPPVGAVTSQELLHQYDRPPPDKGWCLPNGAPAAFVTGYRCP